MAKGFRATLTPFIPGLLPHQPPPAMQASSSSSFDPAPTLEVTSKSTGLADDCLLTLRLSTPSFLDSLVVDEWTQRPLFMIETIGRDSTILRSDTTRGVVKVAKVHWPKRAPSIEGMSGVRVAMSGHRWRESEDLLKFGSLFTSRKFNLPGYNDTLKWRRSGTSYSCTTASVKRPVAILDRTAPTAPPRLRIYETLLKQDANSPQSNYAEVPIVLLDLLLVTALLLVSDAEEWKKVSNPTLPSGATSGTASYRSSASSAPASVQLWRNMLPSEPSEAPHSPTETMRPTSPTTSAGGSVGTRSSGGASDFPDTPASAPERPFPYPSGLARQEPIPPVPPLPAHYADWTPPAVPRTPAQPAAPAPGRARRELPMPPDARRRPDQPWLQRAPSFSSGTSSLGHTAHARTPARPSTSSAASTASSSAYVSTTYARRGSYDDTNSSGRGSPAPSQHPYALASAYDPRAPSPPLSPRRAVPEQRSPPTASLPLPPKLAREKQPYVPGSAHGPGAGEATGADAVHALAGRLRDAALFGDLPPGRESVFEMPPPAYDAIFASPRSSAFASPTSTTGATIAAGETPRADQHMFDFHAGPSQR